MPETTWHDLPQRAPRRSTIWLVSLLIVLALIPLRVFLRRFIESDYLALAASIPDGSFYYLLPAWRFIKHGFFTFDGVHRTYGFQPLFMVLLTGLSAILPSIEDVLRTALCINATLHVVTAVLVGLVVNTVLSDCSVMVRHIASLVAAAIYLLGWDLFWTNLALKENSLAAFLYVLAILCLLRALSTQRDRSIGSDLWLGTLIGLLILARLLPSSLLASGVMLSVVWVWLTRRSAMIISAAAIVPVLAWGIYATLAFGHVLPSSMSLRTNGVGIVGAVLHWRSVGLAGMGAWLRGYVRWAFSFLSDETLGPLRFLSRAGFLGVGAGCLAVCMALVAWWSRTRTTIVLLASVSLVGVLAIPALLPTTTRQLLTYFTWYLFDISAILAIACAAALGFLGHQGIARLPKRWANPHPRLVATLVAMIWLGAAVTEARWYRAVPILRWDRSGCANYQGPCAFVPDSSLEKTEANNALWFRSSVSLADGERVGAFNAGFVGLLLLPNPVVNLDGFANDDIQGDLLGRVGAWPSPTLADYISRERIHYVIDHVPQWTEWKTVVGLNPELLKNTEAISPSVGSRWYYIVRFMPPSSSQDATRPERTSRRTFASGRTAARPAL